MPTTSPEQPFQPIDDALIEGLIAAAGRSPRRRINHNFHRSPEDNPHRFLNVILAGSYVTPHRHLAPPKAESFLVLRGALLLCLFDDTGGLTTVHRLDEGGPIGIDLAPGIWHSLIVPTGHAVIYEVKPGPYDPATDKEFAPWAPREGQPECPSFLEGLQRRAQALLFDQQP